MNTASPDRPRLVPALALLLVLAASPLLHAEGWKEGVTLPDLKGFGLGGTVPENLKGKVILLDFWATWCGPCKASFPVMNELQKTYGTNGFVVIAISVDDKKADMEKHLAKNPVGFVTLHDSAQKVVAAADVATMPTSFLIDRSGKIRYVHTGFEPDRSKAEYAKQIDSLLKENSPKP
jgi:thiol-disulfide isomerase/thioredoxin